MARQTIVVHCAKSYLSHQQEKQASEAPQTASASPAVSVQAQNRGGSCGSWGPRHCSAERVVGKIESNITSHGGKLCSEMPLKLIKAENYFKNALDPSGITDPY